MEITDAQLHELLSIFNGRLGSYGYGELYNKIVNLLWSILENSDVSVYNKYYYINQAFKGRGYIK